MDEQHREEYFCSIDEELVYPPPMPIGSSVRIDGDVVWRIMGFDTVLGLVHLVSDGRWQNYPGGASNEQHRLVSSSILRHFGKPVINV